MVSNGEKRIASFFNDRAFKFGDSHLSLDWGSRESQLIRFDVIFEACMFDGKSVLDVGCGLADFYGYLLDRGISVSYTGVDLSRQLVTVAREKYPNLNLRELNILEDNIEMHDIVVGSGIHYFKVEDNLYRTQKLLQKMYSLCREAVVTNMLITESDKVFKSAEHVHRFHPSEILNIAIDISKLFVLRADYLPHDLTVCLKKS